MNRMNTTLPPALPTELLHWPINDITPSPFQERKHFEPQALAELAESIKVNGIIQPLTVRRVNATGPLELVCGARRLRGGKLAGLETVPIILRILSDAAAENIVLTENIQREDLTPSEEARSYQRMLELRDDSGKLMHTRETVAKLACKPLHHVDDHLKLLACPPELMTAVDTGVVKLGVAKVVGRIPDPKLRPLAASKVLKPSYQQTPMNVAQAKELVRTEFMVSLAATPWKMDDASLVPVRHEEREGQQVRCFGGDCASCPFLSSNLEGVVTKQEGSRQRQAGGAAGNLCTLPKCHQAKLDAVCKQQREAALGKGLKVLNDKESARQFHPSSNASANGAKYVCLDFEPQYHEVGNLSGSANVTKWRSLLKGSGVATVMGRNPHTGLLVEMALLKDAKPVGEKALRAKKPSAAEQAEKSPAELKEDEDLKKRRAAELLKEKIDKLALKEGISDIMAHIERKGADASLLAKFAKLALDRAGSDGTRFLVKHLGIEIDEKKKSWERKDDESILKHAEALCGDRVPAWNGMLALVLMSWSVSFNGLGSEAFKLIAKACGVEISKLQQRAKVMLDAEAKSKPGKKEAAKPAATNSTDPVNWSADKEAGKTKAADKRAKGKSANAKDYTTAAEKKKLEAVQAAITATSMVMQSAVKASGDASLPFATLPQPPEKWNAAAVEAGAKLLRAKTHKVTDLIGSPPLRKETIKLKNFNAVRLRLMRKAGKVK